MACETCHELSVRNEELEAEVAQLKAELYGEDWDPPKVFGLSRTERGLLRAFVVSNGRYLSRNFLLDVRASILGYHNEPNPKIIDVNLSHMRAKLRPFGISFETQWATGWRLSDESRARLLNWNTESVAA